MPEIEYAVEAGVARIRLNRPHRKNAFTGAMLEEWLVAVQTAEADAEVRVLLLGAEGDTFCAGGDLKELQASTTALEHKAMLQQTVHRVALAMHRATKPLLCALPGPAIGAGLDMALMTDYRLAARSARFSESYINVGIVPGDGGCWLLPRVVGMSRALRMLWTGEFVEAEEAARIGLVDEVCEDHLLEDRAAELARDIAGRPPVAVQMIKRAARQGAGHDLETALDLISSHMAVVRTTADSAEAFAATRERRTPQFQGR